MKEQKKHDKIELLGKSKLNSIQVLISKTLIDGYIIYDKFVLINNVMRKNDNMKEENKTLKS